jgi:hypothetical protein
MIQIHDGESTADVMQRPGLYLFVGYLAKLSVAIICGVECTNNRRKQCSLTKVLSGYFSGGAEETPRKPQLLYRCTG